MSPKFLSLGLAPANWEIATRPVTHSYGCCSSKLRVTHSHSHEVCIWRLISCHFFFASGVTYSMWQAILCWYLWREQNHCIKLFSKSDLWIHTHAHSDTCMNIQSALAWLVLWPSDWHSAVGHYIPVASLNRLLCHVLLSAAVCRHPCTHFDKSLSGAVAGWHTHTHTRSRSVVATLRPFVFVLAEDQTVKQQQFLSSSLGLLSVSTFPVPPFIHDQLIKKTHILYMVIHPFMYLNQQEGLSSGVIKSVKETC